MIDHADTRIVERTLINAKKNFILPGQLGHGRVEVHQGEVFHIRIFENLPGGQPVSASQKQDIFAFLDQSKQGMHQRFVIPFLIVGTELRTAIYKKPIIVFPLRDDNFLVPGLFLVNNFIFIFVLFAV